MICACEQSINCKNWWWENSKVTVLAVTNKALHHFDTWNVVMCISFEMTITVQR